MAHGGCVMFQWGQSLRGSLSIDPIVRHNLDHLVILTVPRSLRWRSEEQPNLRLTPFGVPENTRHRLTNPPFPSQTPQVLPPWTRRDTRDQRIYVRIDISSLLPVGHDLAHHSA